MNLLSVLPGLRLNVLKTEEISQFWDKKLGFRGGFNSRLRVYDCFSFTFNLFGYRVCKSIRVILLEDSEGRRFTYLWEIHII